ncbi:uncharacterized protein PG986_004730 [Apiospora aurea]|uniref:Coiled-coil domain-containing protein 16 n=1 Tax=Apiospora aurea TaxID=335848 RepID=A0ABR1QNT9_9PEZI
MSDARALLRAHRAANRIEHPHAAYSDAGKLLCKLCHEAVKSESLWDGHVRSAAHRQKLTALQSQQQQQQPPPSSSSDNTHSTTTTINHKRKHGVDEDDIDMDDAADGLNGEGAARKKKSRTDDGEGDEQRALSTGAGEGKSTSNTPPSPLTRRTSNAPEKGVEIAIPSRPATPLLNGRSPQNSSSTPNTSHGAAPTSAPSTLAAATTTTFTSGPAAAGGKSVDEAEWALFEAEIADTAEPTPPPPSSLPNPSDASGVISAPALTADQIAAKSEEEENERRKLRFDAEIADEREDATRALEDEFDEMEELEARVRRLKEKREELRRGSMANLRAAAGGAPDGAAGKMKAKAAGKENKGVAEDTEEDDEDEEDEEDFDDGFRFRV